MKKLLFFVFIFIALCISPTFASELHEYWQITPQGAQKIINGTLIIKEIGQAVPYVTIDASGTINCVTLNAQNITGSVVYVDTVTAVEADLILPGSLPADVIASSIAVGSVGFAQMKSEVMKFYDYAVEYSTPPAMGTGAWVMSPFRSYSVTLSSISAHSVGAGSTVTIMVRFRDADLADGTAGTNIWTGNVVATDTGWTGGTPSNFYIPANACLSLHIISWTGDPVALRIKYKITVN